MAPKVSILLPVKNAAKWLDDCLMDIYNQTETDWECIVVNDHSTDQTKQMASGYAFCDARFRILENEGNGLIDANITALKNAKGMFITRMDGDDKMPAYRLEKMLDVFEKNAQIKNLVVTGKVQFFPRENCGTGTLFYENWLNGLCENNSHFDWIWRECVIPSPCWMARKTELENAGGFNSPGYPEDYDLAFRFWEKGFTVKSVPEICHFWRQHEGRFSRTENYAAENFMQLKWKYFAKNEFPKFDHIVLLGTGDKAKILKNILQQHKVLFDWVSHEENIAGNIIHGMIIQNLKNIVLNKTTAVISTLSSIDQFEDVYDFIRVKEAIIYRFC